MKKNVNILLIIISFFLFIISCDVDDTDGEIINEPQICFGDVNLRLQAEVNNFGSYNYIE